jgi:hypothetical protein
MSYYLLGIKRIIICRWKSWKQRIHRVLAFVQRVVSGVGDFIVKDVTCKECAILREWLEEEKAKRDFYEQLYLTKTGAFGMDATPDLTPENFKPIIRKSTLSSVRRILEQKSRNQARTAKPEELNEAEQVFQESLNKVTEKLNA